MPKILVIDDELAIRELLATALGLENFEVTTMPRASQALAAMEREAYDLVLTDLNMPDESGLSLIKKIRSAQSRVPIVVYSGYITTEMQMQLRQAGATEILEKGGAIKILLDQVRKILSARDRLPRPSSGKGVKNILIVDDEQPVRDVLELFFEKKGYRIRKAANGTEALAMAAEEKPSIVLLDMDMPGMNGLEVLEKLRNAYPNLGALIMTGASRDQESVQKALALGAYGYILKPFDFLYLELVVTSKLLIAEEP
ncbi:MAG TPA: response regulator [Verrucomicrobiae bacterium]|nr:response regulator [Verrucomicrobiae bacterium]